MMDPRDFVKLLFETYDKSAVVDFREFLKTNVGIKKWQIAADIKEAVALPESQKTLISQGATPQKARIPVYTDVKHLDSVVTRYVK